MFKSIKQFLKKNAWAKYIALALAVVLGAGIVMDATGTAATPIDFRVGGLDENGKFLDTTASIYTPKTIKLSGLTIEPDFNADVTYDIIFYNKDGSFNSVLADQTVKFVEDLKAESCPYADATDVRIVITPGKDDDISALEVVQYAAQLKICYE